jgi:hypothetical protein
MARTFAAVFAQRSQANALPDKGNDLACLTRLPASVGQKPQPATKRRALPLGHARQAKGATASLRMICANELS